MKRLLPGLVLLAFIFSGCAVAQAPMVTEYRTVEGDYAAQPGAPAMGGGFAPDSPPMAMEESYKAFDAASAAATAPDRLVIQNADLNIVVADPKAKMDAIAAMAARMGGFVVSSSLYQNVTPGGQKVPEGSISVRIPAEKLDQALDEIKQGVGEVLNESRSGQDVTQSYTDLRSRLKNLELAERQLQEILDKTTDPEAVVNLFNQLVYYREQIELVKGQMQYFEQAAALSAVSVRIVAEESIAPIEIGGWKPQGVARDAVQALVNFLQGFTNAVIYLVILVIPAMAVIFFPLWLAWRALRRLMRGNKAKLAKPAGPESNAPSKPE